MKSQITPLNLPNKQYVRTCSISADGKYIILGQGVDSKESTLTVWSLDSLELVKEFKGTSQNSIINARFLPINHEAIFVDSTRKINSLNLKKEKTKIIDIADLNIDWLSCAYKRNRFVASGALTYVWDAEEDRVIWTSPEGAVGAIYDDKSALGALNPDGTKIAIAGMEENLVVIYSLENNQVIKKLLNGPARAAKWISYDPTESYLAAITYEDQAVLIWDIKKGERYRLEDELEGFWCLAFHPSGKYLAMGKISGFVEILNLESGEIVLSEHPHTRRVCDIAFSPDGSKMVSAGEGGAFLWTIDELD